jgi:hypothetical protein
LKEAAVADRVVVAPRESGVAAMADLRLDLLAAMDKAGPDDTVILDMGNISNADSAFAQLVIAFRHEARLRDQRIVLAGEGSKNSVSALLGCDTVCEACAFNDFKARITQVPTGMVPAEVVPSEVVPDARVRSQVTPKAKRSRT